jgi:hypothetical protein
LRGLALVNDFTVLRRLHGEAFVQKVVDRLTAAQRAEYEQGFLPGRWYEEDIQARLCLVLREQLDDAGVVRVGVAIVKYHVSRAQRFLARLAGPKRVLARSAGLWSYWRDTGRLEVEQETQTGARVSVLGHPLLASPGYGLMYGGASVAILALAGGREVRFRLEDEDPQRVVAHVRWAPNEERGEGFFSIDEALASLPELG